MTSRPDDTSERLNNALAAQRAGDVAQAIRIYTEILQTNPSQAEARYLLGLAHHQTGNAESALAEMRRAFPHLPADPDVRLNLGLIEVHAGAFQEASETLEPLAGTGLPAALNALAHAYRKLGEIRKAEETLSRWVTVEPQNPMAHFNLGNLRLAEGNMDGARQALQTAHSLAPGEPSIARNLAACLQTLGDLKPAEKLLETVLRQTPDDAAALNNLGNIFRMTGKMDKARDTLNAALEVDPALADAAYNLGAVLSDLNETEAARETFRCAAVSRPGFAKAEWARAMAMPQIYESEDHVAETRKRALDETRRLLETPLPKDDSGVREHLSMISEITPFALAYQGADDAAFMHAWGARVTAIATRAFPALAEPPTPPHRARKRIGFVSAHWRAHTVERLFSGWMTGLDRNRFEVHMISSGLHHDERTRQLANNVEAAHTAPLGLGELATSVRALACDVLIYPDIGMDPRTQVLAALPLAKTQAMSWGHPVTSGLEHMDIFLSAEIMEPTDGERHYTERLNGLPNLSVRFERPAPPGVHGPDVTFLCAQSLFKIPPRQDRVFAEILKAAPGHRLGFIRHPRDAVTAAFQRRIAGACRHAGVDPEKAIVFLPPTDRDGFLGYLHGARVVLDTFDWSGGNTSLETLAMGRPVVTLPGPYMRARHTFGMLNLMGVDAGIADSAGDYVARAVRLVDDAVFLAEAEHDIATRADILFNDDTPISALGGLLETI